jgi:hypothetical protein
MVSATADFRPDILRRVEECQDKGAGRELWLFVQDITTMKTKPQQEKLVQAWLELSAKLKSHDGPSMLQDDCAYEEVISITERVATLILGIDASDRPSNKQVFETVIAGVERNKNLGNWATQYSQGLLSLGPHALSFSRELPSSHHSPSPMSSRTVSTRR